MIYSHRHVDHFGGVRGVVSEADVASGKIPIYAPDGFFEHAISENVMAGNVMGARGPDICTAICCHPEARPSCAAWGRPLRPAP